MRFPFTDIWIARNTIEGSFTLITDRDEATEWLDLDPEIHQYVPLDFRRFVEDVAELGCKGRPQQPYPCDQLPGYEKRLWCIACLARDLLKEHDPDQECDHEWVDPSNSHVIAGDHRFCLKCHRLAIPEEAKP